MIRPARGRVYRNYVSKIIRPLPPRIGVEVGVERGLLSEFLLTQYRKLCLVMVDSWSGADQSAHDANRMEASERTQRFADRRLIIPETSVRAARQFRRDGIQFDFVFIDADHGYRAVRDDMAAWWGRVRSGGILFGHDYGRHYPGVVAAVDEWAGKTGVKVETWRRRIWIVRK